MLFDVLLTANLQKTPSVCFWIQHANPVLLVKPEPMCIDAKSDGIDISAHLHFTQHCLEVSVGLSVSRLT